MDIRELTNNTPESELEPESLEQEHEHELEDHDQEADDLTEDEGTAAADSGAEDGNDTLMDSIHNDSDGTVSENEAIVADEETEVEASDVSDEEEIEERHCEWQGCSTVAESPSELTSHILHEHIDDKTRPGQSLPLYHCRWKDCNHNATLRYRMVCHVRRHSQDTPFYCFVPTCPDSFVDAIELSTHLVSAHGESRLDNFEWMTQIDQIKLDNLHPLPKREVRSIKRVTRMTERELIRSLNASKVDFLKIQNVSVDDIVTEPLKKKGRTANADINADLREEYRKTNTVLKDRVIMAAKESFKESSAVEGMPSYTEIDSMEMQSLQDLQGQLERKLLWSLEVNELLNNELKALKTEENKWWSKKELILDSTIMIELPEKHQLYIPN